MKTKKILTGYLIFSLLAGLGLAVWRTILLYRFYDPYADKFTHAANIHLDAMGYTMLACLVLLFSSAFLLRGCKFRHIETSAHQVSVFASSLLGCLFVAAGVLSLVYYGKEMFTVGTPFYRILLALAVICAFVCALYFFLSATSRFDGTRLKKGLSFFPTLFATAYLGAAYLSPDFVFSDSNDILRNVALAALVFFFIHETRAAFYGKSESLRLPFAFTVLTALLAHVLPMLIVTAFWEMELSFMSLLDLILCGAAIYAVGTARTLIIGLLPKEETPLETRSA